MTTEEWRREWIALHERLARLEEARNYQYQMLDQHLYGLATRLDRLESARAQDNVLGMSALLKIMLAICLPLLVLLLTGDWKAALHSFRVPM